ncbi:MAG: CarD family transcriptional regulator [Ruminococcus sp.]|jgi:CarD family transcriptional regulator
MFQKGELIVYGNAGVCEVLDVTSPEMKGVKKGTLYYVLQPCHHKGEKIFTPVDNEKTPMRKILSRHEAEELIEDMPEIDALWIENDKMREARYKECIRSCDCREWVRMIKSLYMRKMRRLKVGKPITVTDEKYLKQAEDRLYSELSLLFDIPQSDVERYIIERIENKC